MTLASVVETLELQVFTPEVDLETRVKGGYVGDLLSDVIANAKSGSIWVTLQTHENIVAVAVLKELSGIVLVNGKQPDGETAARASKEGIAILGTDLPAFEMVTGFQSAGFSGGRQ
jgi:hypothetical protein